MMRNDDRKLVAVRTDLRNYTGRPVVTPGAIVLICTAGTAVVECNFVRRTLRPWRIAVIFTDCLFTVVDVAPGFEARFFELSPELADESTFANSGPLFDWLYECPLFTVPAAWRPLLGAWLATGDSIAASMPDRERRMMQRNHWQNFFLGLEGALAPRHAETGIKPIGASRRIFNDFCRLLGENCRRHHDVRYYADRLCITPYYLSRVTSRIFGVAPKELIDRQIVMEIKGLLGSTESSVKEIAHSYGFESSSYLGRYFRRHTGLTPSQYRATLC